MVQRILLWERRNNTVEPFGETVQQVFARVSALRDRLDGTVVSICAMLSVVYHCCVDYVVAATAVWILL